MRIAIITDGNHRLGMGHVYQTMALTAWLGMAGHAEIYFITKSGEEVVSLLKKTGKPVSRCEDDNDIFLSLCDKPPDRVVIDKLDTDPELARKVADELRIKLIILTNLTDANRYADVTVMAGMGSEFKNIRRQTGSGQIQYWGPKYWLIRPEFFEHTHKAAKSIRKIMLIFGGSDQANLSTLVLAELLKIDFTFTITLVLGAAFANHAELDVLLSSRITSPSTVNIVQNLEAVAEVMGLNDLVVASPGLSCFEALVVGTPVLCFHQNSFQRNAWKGFIKTYDKSEVSMIQSIIESESFLFPHEKFVANMEIGKGINEIISEIIL